MMMMMMTFSGVGLDRYFGKYPLDLLVVSREARNVSTR